MRVSSTKSRTAHGKLLYAVKTRSGGQICTARPYLEQILKCGSQCHRYFGDIPRDVLKEANQRLTYATKGMVIEKSARSFDGLLPDGAGVGFPKNTLLGFRNVVTTNQEDRDTDILETAGAIVEPDIVLLWQHLHTLPIGRGVAIYEHNEKTLRVVSALLDLNELTEDSAKLIEAGCLDISHGFRALQYEERKGPNGEEHYGFRVTKFEILEHSLVSVPSNPGAAIELYSRGKLQSDLAKAWAKSLSDRRPKQSNGVSVNNGEVNLKITVEQNEKKPCSDSCPRCAAAEPPVSASGQEQKPIDLDAILTSAKQTRTDVQSVVCSKEKFKTAESAKKWVSDHNFTVGKVDETEDSWRFRQFEPTKCQERTFRTIELTGGVQAVICRPKCAELTDKTLAPSDHIRELLANGTIEELKRCRKLIDAVLGVEESISAGEQFRSLLR